MELHTKVPVGFTLGFNSVPINPVSGDQVIITGFNVSQGSVFGSAGYPRQQPPLGTQPAGLVDWSGDEFGQSDLSDPDRRHRRRHSAGHVLRQLGPVYHGTISDGATRSGA